jgi:hypothetical protein
MDDQQNVVDGFGLGWGIRTEGGNEKAKAGGLFRWEDGEACVYG